MINTSIANFTPWYQRINVFALGRLVLITLSQRSPQAIEKSILQICSNLPIQQNTLDCWTQYRREQPTRFINVLRQLVAAARFKARFMTNISPLILNSKNDRLVNYLASKNIHQRLGGQLIIHASAGHDLPLDDAIWVIQQIKQHTNMS